MKKYNTKQRELLIEFFRTNCGRQYSVDEITRQVCDAGGISPSAVYRNISHMVAEGALRKLSVDGSRHFLYQYVDSGDCSRHIHLKCEGCGQVFHMDAEAMAQMLAVTRRGNDFAIDIKRTILYGLCKYCS